VVSIAIAKATANATVIADVRALVVGVTRASRSHDNHQDGWSRQDRGGRRPTIRRARSVVLNDPRKTSSRVSCTGGGGGGRAREIGADANGSKTLQSDRS